MAALSITLRQGVCLRAQTRPTRLLRPDGLTWPEYQLTRPTWLTRILMTSAWCKCDVSMHSRHAMSAATSSAASRAKPSRVEPSRCEAEPSRELRDKILCSRVYVQPDLRLNLGRSSGQNCFDQILAVWNAIWTISDLFPANLIVPDAMVRSDHWDLRPKMVVVNYWKRLPDEEASEGHHGGRWRWRRRKCTCLPNYMCWTAKWGEILIALREGKIGILWTPDHVDDLRWRVEIDEDQSWRI